MSISGGGLFCFVYRLFSPSLFSQNLSPFRKPLPRRLFPQRSFFRCSPPLIDLLAVSRTFSTPMIPSTSPAPSCNRSTPLSLRNLRNLPPSLIPCPPRTQVNSFLFSTVALMGSLLIFQTATRRHLFTIVFRNFLSQGFLLCANNSIYGHLNLPLLEEDGCGNGSGPTYSKFEHSGWRADPPAVSMLNSFFLKFPQPRKGARKTAPPWTAYKTSCSVPLIEP